ncbi:acyloxyacyl hydrolase [Alteromonas pelagimontana]|uniref:Acyloxyacyl hydrolase n=1 Tax=Alteromonas pelagimontana TaxID=1858656 RepID=A0A6M4ME88_9ALTE|nr:acyloxyacyl hydrolase [Alteromonas pelagimontana]QJR81168.1 acyloxyacyl hydrolase [Alteromonas pelagimontana]
MSRRFLAFGLVGALSVFGLVTPTSVYADEWHITSSYSTDQLRGARVGYRWTDISVSILQDWKWLGSPKLHLEGALNNWQNSNDHSDNIFAFTISPVLAWQLSDGPRPLYLEAGIGGSYLDATRLSNRRLSTRFQFEDRIGVSWQYLAHSDARIMLSYVHYSNADINRPNDGLDFFGLTWSNTF